MLVHRRSSPSTPQWNFAFQPWWTFRIFFFVLLGGGEGGDRGARKGRGSVFLLKIQGGGGSPTRGGGGGGAGRVSAGNFGEPNIFFGAEMPTKQLSVKKNQLFGPDLFGGGGGSSTWRGGGSRRSACPLKPRETFLAGYFGEFAGIFWGCLKSLITKRHEANLFANF